MESKKIIEHTSYGAILAQKKGESVHDLVKKQQKKFEKANLHDPKLNKKKFL